MTNVPLHYPDRAVPHLLGGVLYQAVWTALRWTQLADGEVLVVEGDEDIVRAVIDATTQAIIALEQQQIKDGAEDAVARVLAAVRHALLAPPGSDDEGERASNPELGDVLDDDDENDDDRDDHGRKAASPAPRSSSL